MNILISGGTGLIGRAFISRFSQDNNATVHFCVLTRQTELQSTSNISYLTSLDQIAPACNIDVIINLAGEPIADARWSDSRKQKLLDSRVGVTDKLVAWIASREAKPKVLLSGSAVGWYGDNADNILNEASPAVSEFSHELCEVWEKSALNAEQYGVRVCILRTGLVMSSAGGFLERMLLPFKLGLGGPLGSGRQYMPWVHMDDLVAIITFLLQTETCQGVYNGVAPEPVTNAAFSKALADTLKRPCIFRVPAFVLRLLLGEMASLLLGGQRAIPKRLEEQGFEFKYSDIGTAMRDVLK